MLGKRIIFQLILTIVATAVYYLIFDNTTFQRAIVFAVLYFVMSVVLEIFRERRQVQKSKQVDGAKSEVDVKISQALTAALGGKDNIETASHDGGRVKIKLIDSDLIIQDQLQELPLDGAVLTGDYLQLSIGANSADFAQLIVNNSKNRA